MSNSTLDADSLIAMAAGLVAATCLLMAVRSFSNRRIVAGLAWLAGLGVSGFVAYFFATFAMRLF